MFREWAKQQQQTNKTQKKQHNTLRVEREKRTPNVLDDRRVRREVSFVLQSVLHHIKTLLCVGCCCIFVLCLRSFQEEKANKVRKQHVVDGYNI